MTECSNLSRKRIAASIAALFVFIGILILIGLYLQLLLEKKPRLVHVLETGGAIDFCAMDSRGAAVCTASVFEQAIIWDLSTGQKMLIPTCQPYEPIASLAYALDGKTLAVAGAAHNLTLYQLPLLNPTTRESPGFGSILLFSPNGRRLVRGCEDGTLAMWDILPLQEKNRWADREGRISALAFSPSGHLLASGGEDNNIHIWNINDNHLVSVLRGHTGTITCLGFSPDGDILASGSLDCTVRLWSLPEGQLLNTLRGKSGSIRSIGFDPHRPVLAVGCGDASMFSRSTVFCLSRNRNLPS